MKKRESKRHLEWYRKREKDIEEERREKEKERKKEIKKRANEKEKEKERAKYIYNEEKKVLRKMYIIYRKCDSITSPLINLTI